MNVILLALVTLPVSEATDPWRSFFFSWRVYLRLDWWEPFRMPEALCWFPFSWSAALINSCFISVSTTSLWFALLLFLYFSSTFSNDLWLLTLPRTFLFYALICKNLILSSRVELILFLSNSSMIIQSDSFPLKKINGIWQARTVQKRNYRTKLSHLSGSIMCSTLTCFIRSDCSPTLDPNMKTQMILRRLYIRKVNPIP